MSGGENSNVWEMLNSATSVPSLLYLTGALAVLAIVLGPLELIFPASKQPLWRYKGLKLDLVYWFFTPIFTKMATNYVLAVVLIALFAWSQAPAESILQGRGPLSRQPLWLQSLEIIVLADFIDYWTHRIFHSPRLWRIHAIHHSPEEMTWISSARMHPVNDLVTRFFQVVPLCFLGFSASAVIVVVPALFFYVIFLHSNLSWTFGPFRYVLVSPAYHRWHHTSDAEGIDKNFAGIFPIWDLLFGTCHFPDRLPERYGVVKEKVPATLVGQLLFPFRASSESTEGPAPSFAASAGAHSKLAAGNASPAPQALKVAAR